MNREELKQFLEAFGWIDLGKVKNPYMYSFVKEETNERLNYYHTTGTVTIQKGRNPCKTYRTITKLDELENILSI